MKYAQFILLIIVLLVIISCTPQMIVCESQLSEEGALNWEQIEDYSSIKIEMFDIIKDHTIVIHGNGTYYEKLQNEDVNPGQISWANLFSLLVDFEQNQFESMNAYYKCNQKFEDTTEISFKSNKFFHSVNVNGPSGPPQFIKLKEKIVNAIGKQNNEIDGDKLMLLSIEKLPIEFLLSHKGRLLSLITDNRLYCDSEDSKRNCICQEGYVKIWDNIRYSCLPEPCSLVVGATFFGDINMGHVGEPNYRLCDNTLSRRKIEICNMINYQQGKDLCTFGYVQLTNEIDQCDQIFDVKLKNECYK